MTAPRYAHDCTACTFLGTYKHFDLYTCKTSMGFSCIARSGDEPPEYASMPSFILENVVSKNPTPDLLALRECLRRQHEA